MDKSGPRFNIKMTSYQYRKSHCGDKMILWPSYLHNGISYTGKMISLYWIRALPFSPVNNYGLSMRARCRSLCFPWIMDKWLMRTHRSALGSGTGSLINSAPPGQNGCHFGRRHFQINFLEWKLWILIKISLKFVSKGSFNNKPAYVQVMAWHRTGNKLLFEPMMTQFIDAYMRH